MIGILLRGGQEVASPGQNRTGLCLIPLTKFDREPARLAGQPDARHPLGEGL